MKLNLKAHCGCGWVSKQAEPDDVLRQMDKHVEETLHKAEVQGMAEPFKAETPA